MHNAFITVRAAHTSRFNIFEIPVAMQRHKDTVAETRTRTQQAQSPNCDLKSDLKPIMMMNLKVSHSRWLRIKYGRHNALVVGLCVSPPNTVTPGAERIGEGERRTVK